MRAVVITVFHNLVIVSFITALLVICAIAYPHTDDIANRPDAIGSSVELASRYDCWGVYDTPKGVIPGHVIIRGPHDIAYAYKGAGMVDKALNQLLGNTDTDYGVYAFCK